MPSTAPPGILEPFLAAADAAASSRPDVDAETAREVMAEERTRSSSATVNRWISASSSSGWLTLTGR